MSRGKSIFIGALFIASVFIIGIKLLNPTLINIYVEGSDIVVTQIPGFFTFTDVIILVAASIVLGISGMYLLFFDSTGKPAGRSVLEERRKKWKEISKGLKENEQNIYKVIIDSDGIINQSELVEKTGLPKSNVSRALDLLESRGLIERKRRGMGNIVLLK